MVIVKKGKKSVVEEVFHGNGGDVKVARKKDHILVTLADSSSIEFELDVKAIKGFLDNVELLSQYSGVWIQHRDRNKKAFTTLINGDDFIAGSGDQVPTVAISWGAFKAVLEEIVEYTDKELAGKA